MNKTLAKKQNFKKEVKGMKRIISLCISLALVFSMVQSLGVSAKTTQQLEGTNVTRYSGTNRINTALDISGDFTSADSVVLASGNGFADALQDRMPTAVKAVLFEQAENFFKGTASDVIAAVNAA